MRDHRPPLGKFPPCSMSGHKLYVAAAAYIEQYGDLVGDGMILLFDQALDHGGQQLASNLMAIVDLIEGISDTALPVGNALPKGLRFSN